MLGLERAHLVVIVADGVLLFCFSFPPVIHADENIHVIYGFVDIRTM